MIYTKVTSIEFDTLNGWMLYNTNIIFIISENLLKTNFNKLWGLKAYKLVCIVTK